MTQLISCTGAILYNYVQSFSAFSLLSIPGSCPGHTVLVLSPEDGRQRLTELARKLSTSVLKRQIRVTDVDCHLLTDKLVCTFALICTV